MLKFGNTNDFILEFIKPLLGGFREPLHSYLLSLFQHTLTYQGTRPLSCKKKKACDSLDFTNVPKVIQACKVYATANRSSTADEVESTTHVRKHKSEIWR